MRVTGDKTPTPGRGSTRSYSAVNLYPECSPRILAASWTLVSVRPRYCLPLSCRRRSDRGSERGSGQETQQPRISNAVIRDEAAYTIRILSLCHGQGGKARE